MARPLDFLGIDTEAVFSSLELSQHFRVNGRHVLITYTEDVGEIQLRLPKEAVQSIRCDGRYEFEGERLIVNLHADESCHIESDRFGLTIYAMTPEGAARVDQVTKDGMVLIRWFRRGSAIPQAADCSLSWNTVEAVLARETA